MAEIITIESLLNEKKLREEDFLGQLLKIAVELKAITDEEGEEIKNSFSSVIMQHFYELVSDEFEGEVTTLAERIVANHLYIISIFLAKMENSGALEYIIKTPTMLVHKEALADYNRRLEIIGSKLSKLEEVTKKADYDTKNLKMSYESVKKMAVIAARYDSNVDITVKSVPTIRLMSYSAIDGKNILDFIEETISSIILEISIRNKFGKDVLRYIIKNDPSLNNNEEDLYTKEKLKREELDKSFDLKLKRKFKSLEIKKNKECKEAEGDILKLKEIEKKYEILKKDFEISLNIKKKKELDKFLDEIESEDMKENDEIPSYIFDSENILEEVIIELSAVTLSMDYENFLIPADLAGRRKILRNVPKEKFFDSLFSHPEIVKFSDEEKEYLKKYFVI